MSRIYLERRLKRGQETGHSRFNKIVNWCNFRTAIARLAAPVHGESYVFFIPAVDNKEKSEYSSNSNSYGIGIAVPTVNEISRPLSDNGKPVARLGRKATGQVKT